MIDIATLQASNAPTREGRLENLQKAVQTASFPEANLPPLFLQQKQKGCALLVSSITTQLPVQRRLSKPKNCRYARHSWNGSACQYGLHGRISNTPAETVSARGEWVGDRYCMVFEGTVRESMALGQRLVLRRKVTSWLDSAQITVEDIISNESWYETPLLTSILSISVSRSFPPLRKLISIIRFPLSATTMPPISVGSQTLMAAMLRPRILPNRSICSIYSRIMVSAASQFKIRLSNRIWL